MQEIDFNEIFNDSYEYVMANDELIFGEFYKIFLSSSPKIGEAFIKTDIEKQKNMLREAIATLVTFFVTKKANTYMASLAARHAEVLGNDIDFYSYFIESLLESLKQNYPRYTPICGLAWRVTLAPGIEFMKHMSNLSD